MNNGVPPYPPITRFARGSYKWAMDQLDAGNEVRRWHWPIEKIDRQDVGYYDIRIWHLYKLNDYGGMCQGFNSGIVGADNDYYEGLGIDSMGYYPSTEDLEAKDWQLVSEVTTHQIEFIKPYRHWPSYPTEPRERESDAGTSIVWIIVCLVFIVVLMLISRRW